MSDATITTRHLGLTDYVPTWQAMQEFTNIRQDETLDELWVCEHAPVYTLGQAGRMEHILGSTEIPIVKSDRGGQVTYHGPGQIIVYCLINLRRAGFGVRELVVRLENSAIETLAAKGIKAQGRRDAPGVYVDGAKIAALGLRVRRGCCYHGIALNMDPDLTPFMSIDPCGYKGMAVTSLKTLGISFDKHQLLECFTRNIQQQLVPSTKLAQPAD